MAGNLALYATFVTILVVSYAEAVNGTKKSSRGDVHLKTEFNESKANKSDISATTLTRREEYCKAKNWSMEFGW